jgi:hypothetical protein
MRGDRRRAPTIKVDAVGVSWCRLIAGERMAMRQMRRFTIGDEVSGSHNPYNPCIC